MNDSRRKVLSIALGTCLLVLFAALAALNAFNKRFLDPETTGQIFIYTGLSIVAFLLFVAVLIMLVRNVLKLYADQRSNVMGTRLRTRMLWGAVLVSLLPISFMFAFSYLLLNRAVERWFSQPVTEMRDASTNMAFELARYTTANARAEAESIATTLPDVTAAPLAAYSAEVQGVLRRHEITLQSGFVAVYRDQQLIASFQVPEGSAVVRVKPWAPESASDNSQKKGGEIVSSNGGISRNGAIFATARRSDTPVFSVGDTDYALGTATARDSVMVVVGLPMPHGLADTMSTLRSAADTYWTLFRSRRQLRNLYMLLLLMMTCLALFSSSWLALHLSKQVTKPVEALADAMAAIAAGDYARRVQESATQELGELVRSFNLMAADLEGSRRAVEESTVQLSAANAALEARRGELETMLETIPNGVAMLDSDRRILLTNRALSELIDPGGQRPFLGLAIKEVFPADLVELLDRLIRRSHRMGTASSEIELAAPHSEGLSGTLNLLITVALLETAAIKERPRREHRGYVLVIEDATELLHAQKQSAWKEVARRVAHEIKNPLTPIGLSAEQIRRHIDRLSETLRFHQIESPSPQVIRRCSEVISGSVESMRSLVDQFSALAEFPTAKPRPADLNTIVENSLAMFAGRMQTITVIQRMARGLPLVMADPEALKRALGNLIDNAAEAMQSSLLRELRISTGLLENGMVELTVADTGSGLTDEMRERLFLPYFSTKERGTGLGLAIAAKIVQEHQGTIRAEKNVPAGAKFIIELRPAIGQDGESETAAVVSGDGGVTA
ncbi:PAS domain-containing sensor histidine kinase [Edaphobacter sp. 12200R-103]|jgi:nitrogen fixation/metabolism regulation signal transduction histidine kinase|uniref:sensor histidine kinase n=1 Tax=Edaphobacter sp. 12200R-103 TaxID=2703788 RepID=UPI00138D01D4|nr:ATP-binding protein [Edaphobacter sp. 12200R-103]QHS52116.1 HAMP domain-containing protein [Edaphobacter sp. 12200R-103]